LPVNITGEENFPKIEVNSPPSHFPNLFGLKLLYFFPPNTRRRFRFSRNLPRAISTPFQIFGDFNNLEILTKKGRKTSLPLLEGLINWRLKKRKI
jgi:hypothetical protein